MAAQLNRYLSQQLAVLSPEHSQHIISGLSSIVQSNAAAAARPPPPFSLVTGNTSPNVSDGFDAADLAFAEERASLAWEDMDTSFKRPQDDQDQGDDDLDETGDVGPRTTRQRTAEDACNVLSAEEIHKAESLAASIANSAIVQPSSESSVSPSQPSQPSSAPDSSQGAAQAHGLSASVSGDGEGSGGKPKTPIKQQHKSNGAPKKGGRKRG